MSIHPSVQPPTTSTMTRRDVLRMSAGTMAAAAFIGPAALAAQTRLATGPSSKRPNILFIFDDQLRQDACSVFGGKNIQTPHIDRLAAQGMSFNNATSICPLCTPYRGMVQTGRYPTHSGIVLNWIDMNPDQRCMAHIFNDAGYHTGFMGKWHLSAGVRKLAGKHHKTKADMARARLGHQELRNLKPESEFTPPGPQRLGYKHWEVNNFSSQFRNYFYYRDEPEKIFSGKYETDTIADQAIAFMKQNRESAEGQPFMLMLAPHPPHPPFAPNACPAGYRDKITKELHLSPNVTDNHKKGVTPDNMRSYYAMVQNVDDNMGRIMAYLDESGLAENTIVVFTSDHGEMFGSHNRRNKMVPYAEAVNVPLIVRWPGKIAAGTRTDTLQSPIDFMPMLCGLAGLEAPDTADGTDLSPVLLNKGKVDRDAILMANYVSNWDYFDSGTTWPEWRGVRTERFTYAKWIAGEDAGKEELYDNLEDPYQMRNLAQGNQDLPSQQKLRSRMKDLLADAHDTMLLGSDYADWYDDFRNPVKTALGPI